MYTSFWFQCLKFRLGGGGGGWSGPTLIIWGPRNINPALSKPKYFIKYLTIIRLRLGDYRGIFAETKSRWIFPPIITEPEANNCFSIFVFLGTEFILISLISLSE